ncbi:CbiX/SirB N-terminal domain-containing protein [soil metagenome]
MNHTVEDAMNDDVGTTRRGLILFAHGARDPRWALPFEAIAQRVRSRDDQVQVALAYLELMKPSLGEAADALVAAGCGQVDVVPLFLGAGGHVRKDLPVLFDAIAAAHPAVRWHLHRAVGEMESVVDAMAQAAVELTLHPPRPAS